MTIYISPEIKLFDRLLDDIHQLGGANKKLPDIVIAGSMCEATPALHFTVMKEGRHVWVTTAGNFMEELKLVFATDKQTFMPDSDVHRYCATRQPHPVLTKSSRIQMSAATTIRHACFILHFLNTGVLIDGLSFQDEEEMAA